MINVNVQNKRPCVCQKKKKKSVSLVCGQGSHRNEIMDSLDKGNCSLKYHISARNAQPIGKLSPVINNDSKHMPDQGLLLKIYFVLKSQLCTEYY